MFSEKGNSKRKNSWNFEKFWQFFEKNVEFISNLWIFWVFGYSFEFKNAWDKFFNSWKDFWKFPEKNFAYLKEKENVIFEENVMNCLRRNFYQKHDRYY